MLTTNFSDAELACKSGEPTPPEVRLVAVELATTVLEPIRRAWGGPLIPVCWFRSPAYNERLFELSEARARREGRVHGGVARRSQHLTGGAVDIHPVSLGAMSRFRLLVEEMIQDGQLAALGGYGLYPGWLHLDLQHAPGGRLRRWTGAGFGDEQTP